MFTRQITAVPSKEHKADSLLQTGLKYLDNHDEAKGVEYIWRAAELGNAEAQYKMGGIFSKGLCVEMNHEEAACWYLQAATAGNTKAQVMAGQLFRDGIGVPVDGSMAITGAIGYCQKQTCLLRFVFSSL